RSKRDWSSDVCSSDLAHCLSTSARMASETTLTGRNHFGEGVAKPPQRQPSFQRLDRPALAEFDQGEKFVVLRLAEEFLPRSQIRSEARRVGKDSRVDS